MKIKFNIFLLIFFLLVNQPLCVFAASLQGSTQTKSIAVVPIFDGESDEATKLLAVNLTSALDFSSPFDTVENEKVVDVLSYYHKRDSSLGVDSSNDMLMRAKESYLNFEYEEAFVFINQAIKSLEENPDAIYQHGQMLVDAYVAAVLINKAANKSENIRELFDKILKLDPVFSLDKENYPPSLVQVFSEEKAKINSVPKGNLKVETKPKVAEVFLNGVYKGVTPLTISDLPVEQYHVLIQTNKYRPTKALVDIEKNKTIEIKRELSWMQEMEQIPASQSVFHSEEAASRQVEDGVNIANMLKVDKVVLVDVEQSEGGGGEIAVRMVDKKFRAGHQPILIMFNKNQDYLNEHLADMTEILIKQSQNNLLKNTQDKIDPDGVGDPILLNGRRLPLLKTPVFWGGVGMIIIGGLSGGIAAAALSGPSPTTGDVNVNFK